MTRAKLFLYYIPERAKAMAMKRVEKARMLIDWIVVFVKNDKKKKMIVNFISYLYLFSLCYLLILGY